MSVDGYIDDTSPERLLSAGIPRVVFAWREPDLFVDGQGVEDLHAAGVQVIEIADLAQAARDANTHLQPLEAKDHQAPGRRDWSNKHR